MIINSLSEGFKTFKEHKWTILGMWMPCLIATIFFQILSNIINMPNSAGGIDPTDPTAMVNVGSLVVSSLVSFIAIILTQLLSASFQMGLFQSDKDDNYVFQNTFVGFKGITWLGILVIGFLLGLLEFVVGLVFIIPAVLLFFVAYTQGNAIFFALSILIFLIWIVIFAFITLSFYFIFLTYYSDTKDSSLGMLKAFSKTWEIINGHRYELLGLLALEFLIGFAVVFILVLLGIIFGLLLGMALPILAGVFIVFLVIIGTVIFVGLSLWFNVSAVKFFEKLK